MPLLKRENAGTYRDSELVLDGFQCCSSPCLHHSALYVGGSSTAPVCPIRKPIRGAQGCPSAGKPGNRTLCAACFPALTAREACSLQKASWNTGTGLDLEAGIGFLISVSMR